MIKEIPYFMLFDFEDEIVKGSASKSSSGDNIGEGIGWSGKHLSRAYKSNSYLKPNNLFK